MNVCGLFSGIGGLELGFHRVGHETVLMCEIDESCRAVLRRGFGDTPIAPDICALDALPSCDAAVAGFPCQPYSPAGQTRGFAAGQKLVDHLFRLLKPAHTRPSYVVLENVPFILHLDGGRALRILTRRLESLGYSWAYRVVDALSFGIPQRRRRWVLVASLDETPYGIFAGDEQPPRVEDPHAFGFYWTEGNRGLGWAPESVPPLKGGSGLKIPSAPAIWDSARHRIVTPAIEDAERLQGFRIGWTSCTGEHRVSRERWKMVGNAVSVPMAKWIARAIDVDAPAPKAIRFNKSDFWPTAAFGWRGKRFAVNVGEFPVATAPRPILRFMRRAPHDLSFRATVGFLTRLKASPLSKHPDFIRDLAYHARMMKLA